MIELKPVVPDGTPLGEGLELREIRPQELAAVIAFEAQFTMWPAHYRTQFLRWEQHGLAGTVHWVVTDRGAIIASATLLVEAGPPVILERSLGFRVHVVPSHRRRGVGSRLLKTLEQTAMAAQIRYLVTSVDDDDPPSLIFAARHDYREFHRQARWSLRIANSRAHKFPSAERIVRESRLRLVDYAHFAECYADASLRFAHAHLELLGQLPQPLHPAAMAMRDYEAMFLSKPYFEEHATFVALHREQILGLTLTQRDAPTLATSAITAVAGLARARRISLALKLAVIAVAPTLGIEELLTLNDADNAPTLRILRSLGYTPAHDLVRYRRDLARPA